MSEKYLVASNQNVKFFAKHWSLQNLAEQIAENQIFSRSSLPVCVFVGVHEWTSDILRSDRLNIGIQTEQYYDESGKKLWGLSHRAMPAYFLYKFDLLIDINFSNLKSYKFLPLKKSRLIIGPYIFPTNKLQYNSLNNAELIFVGWINDRRHSILDKKVKLKYYRHDEQDSKNLIREISLSAGVLNIHFAEGTYCEWPRMLLAYLSGKIFYSELLGHPLIPGRHFSSLKNNNNKLEPEEIFNNFRDEIASKYQFGFVLKNISLKSKTPISSRILFYAASFLINAEKQLRKLFTISLKLLK
jgi:hypothetical protein